MSLKTRLKAIQAKVAALRPPPEVGTKPPKEVIDLLPLSTRLAILEAEEARRATSPNPPDPSGPIRFAELDLLAPVLAETVRKRRAALGLTDRDHRRIDVKDLEWSPEVRRALEGWAGRAPEMSQER
jgi:hypothetical protein